VDADVGQPIEADDLAGRRGAPAGDDGAQRVAIGDRLECGAGAAGDNGILGPIDDRSERSVQVAEHRGRAGVGEQRHRYLHKRTEAPTSGAF